MIHFSCCAYYKEIVNQIERDLEMNLNIESHEGGIYIAYVEKQGSKEFVKTSENTLHRFRSVIQIKDYFFDREFDNVWLHHFSPYDEMIGLASANNEMKVRLAWN